LWVTTFPDTSNSSGVGFAWAISALPVSINTSHKLESIHGPKLFRGAFDLHEQAVLEILKTKQEGACLPPLLRLANVINLFDALRASIAGAKPDEAPSTQKATAKSGME